MAGNGRPAAGGAPMVEGGRVMSEGLSRAAVLDYPFLVVETAIGMYLSSLAENEDIPFHIERVALSAGMASYRYSVFDLEVMTLNILASSLDATVLRGRGCGQCPTPRFLPQP
jgi:hypothetical protein